VKHVTTLHVKEKVASLVFAILLAGCQHAPPRIVRTGNTDAFDPTHTVGLMISPWDNTSRESCDPQTSQVSISARFLFVEPSFLDKTKSVGASDSVLLTLKECEEILTRAGAELNSRSIECPSLVTFSGRPGFIMQSTNQTFIQDPGFLPEKNGTGQNPTIGNMTSGVLLDVQAHVDGDVVVFERLEPQGAYLLGMRECQARLSRGHRNELVTWQEPVFVKHVAQSFKPVKLQKDQAMLIRLSSTVEQPASKVRINTVRGTVKEQYKGLREDLASECMVLVMAHPNVQAPTN